jgi:hypothetical protein
MTSKEDFKLSLKASIVLIGTIIDSGQVEFDTVSGSGRWVWGTHASSWSHSWIYHCIRWGGG